MSSQPSPRSFSTTFFMSQGARNCPFLTLTGRPLAGARQDQVGLPAEERGDLQEVQDLRRRRRPPPPGGRRTAPGQPNVSRTRREDPRAPPAGPGPRYERADERLALSYDDLYTKGTPASAAIRTSASAVRSAWASSSIAQGPARSASERSPPIGTGPTVTTRVAAAGGAR